MASTQATNTKISALTPVLVFKLLNCKVMLLTKKTTETVKK